VRHNSGSIGITWESGTYLSVETAAWEIRDQFFNKGKGHVETTGYVLIASFLNKNYVFLTVE
jgi:hypothetical protein